MVSLYPRKSNEEGHLQTGKALIDASEVFKCDEAAEFRMLAFDLRKQSHYALTSLSETLMA